MSLFRAATAALVLAAAASWAAADVFTNGSNVIYSYNDDGVRVGSATGSSEEYADVEAGPDGFVYATSNMLGAGLLDRIDPSTGVTTTLYADLTYATYSIPLGLAFGQSGALYAGSNPSPFPVTPQGPGPGKVVRFNFATNTFVPFASVPGTSSDALVTDLAVAPDGDVYAAVNTLGILRFNGTTGAFVTTPVAASEYGFGYGGSRIAFGPDGNLYVVDNSENIDRIDPLTGAVLGTFVSSSAGGAHSVDGLTFSADGKLYVASGSTSKILRFDAASGAFLDVFTSDVGTIRPYRWDAAYVPEPAAAVAVVALASLRRRRRVMASGASA